MNSATAARVVVICGLLEWAFVIARERQHAVTREQTVKSLWAIGVLTLGLSAFADFAPQVAGPFALLVLVALAARSRGELGAALGVGTGASGVDGTSTPSSTSGASTTHPTSPGGESPGGPTGGNR